MPANFDIINYGMRASRLGVDGILSHGADIGGSRPISVGRFAPEPREKAPASA
jgi:hypothetical protein